jgi:hypothetical protein
MHWRLRRVTHEHGFRKRFSTGKKIGAVFVLTLLVAFAGHAPARAITQVTPIQIENPKSGSYGLEATKKQPPPTVGITITSPSNGANFSTQPITVAGLCPTGLLVQIYDNGVFAGSTMCKGGSFSLQISLFSGQNDLTGLDFDDLDQSGPDSNKITVFFNNANFTAFGQLITLTSPYGRRAVDPGDTLQWPIVLSGGSGPYAFSIDWGDGKAPELKSVSVAGNISLSHVYDKAGLYKVTVKVTDHNGVSAFIQMVAVVNGDTTPAATSNNITNTKIITRVLWIPALATLFLLVPAYWLGRRSELVSLRRHLEKDMANFKEL